jgi:CheY-like chemotaxis protein
MNPAPRKRRILIVDDETSITRLLKLVLERTGLYEVETEHSGLRGLAAARRGKPDLILMDLMMPGMTGNETAAAMRQDPDLQRIPLLFLTGAVRQSSPGESPPQVDGHRCLVKPLDTAEVVAAIESVLGPLPGSGPKA